jgi:uncharacterized membrane-anchored protein
VIHHLDLDRASADALVRCRVAAVVNAAASISGRYPNLGPKVLAEAGIPLVDVPDGDVFSAVRDGAPVRIEGARSIAATCCGRGRPPRRRPGHALMARGPDRLGAQLEAFSLNSMEHLRQERGCCSTAWASPRSRRSMADRHVLVVTRGYDYREDLQALRGYIRERRPVLIGVDGGADALREAGYTPDLIVGDLDTVSDDTLQCGAELVAHVPRDAPPAAPGRLERLGADAVVFPATLTSEDVALLLAEAKGAQLVVAVGMHATFDEFLDRGRAGMASKLPDPATAGLDLGRRGQRQSAALQSHRRVAAAASDGGGPACGGARGGSDPAGPALDRRSRRTDRHRRVISFRYHVVSLVAVFFALALGIALGAGPLQESVTSSVADTSDTSDSTAAEQAEGLASAADRIAYDDAFVAAAAPQLLDSRLDATVSVISLPGADPTDVRTAAGAGVGRRWQRGVVHRCHDRHARPGEAGLAQSLAETTLRNAQSTAPEGATSYELLGAAFARAFLTGDPEDSEQDAQAAAIEAALLESDFVTIDGQVDERADVALVVEGSPCPTPSTGPTMSRPSSSPRSTAAPAASSWLGRTPQRPGEPSLRCGLHRSRLGVDGRRRGRHRGPGGGGPRARGAGRGDAGHYGSDDAPDGPLPVAVLSADR